MSGREGDCPTVAGWVASLHLYAVAMAVFRFSMLGALLVLVIQLTCRKSGVQGFSFGQAFAGLPVHWEKARVNAHACFRRMGLWSMQDSSGENSETDGSEAGGKKQPYRFNRISFGIRPRIAKARSALEKRIETAMEELGLGFDGELRDQVTAILERFRRQQDLQDRRIKELLGKRVGSENKALEEARVLPATDISSLSRRIWVITTASLPWMTGTSVNPLLRAAYLARGREKGMITLMLPWVELEDQELLFPADKLFESRSQQEEFVRQWLDKAGMQEENKLLNIVWYDARYLSAYGSIFPMGDITRLIPDEFADVCIMEEPEHLNWFRATGENWTTKFRHVIGVIHTNYAHYARNDRETFGGPVKGPWVQGFNKLMIRAYCDKVVKLSGALQVYAKEKEVISNVHGVREGFLLVGDEAAKSGFSKGAYMIGKMLWEKGYDRLWDLMSSYRGSTGAVFDVDAYGSGPDSEAIQARAKGYGLPATFHPATDHASLSQYKIFVNPSVSEVLCTTVAEALAMGKFTVVARHPSNEFFYQFPNCLPFANPEEFVQQMKFALEHEPTPLSPELRYKLSWEAATDRLIEATKVTVGEANRRRRELDHAAWVFHHQLGKDKRGDQLRKMLQAGPISAQNEYTKEMLAREAAAATAAVLAGEGPAEGAECADDADPAAPGAVVATAPS